MKNNVEVFKRAYKIEVGDVVTVIRNDFKDYTFYKVKFAKRQADGILVEGYKNIRFAKGVELENGTEIRVLDMFEDFYNKDKYTTIWILFISDFEIVDASQAFDNYASALNEAEEDYDELPF